MPPIFRELSFDGLTEVSKGLISLCEKYIGEFPINKKPGLYLFSQIPGNAKSAIAAIILKRIVSLGKVKRKASFISFPDLLNFLRQRYVYGREFEPEVDYESIIQRSELLVFDDVGKQLTDKNLADYYFYIMNKLYEEKKSVIITSNFSLEELRERFEVAPKVLDSVLSRIEAMCDIVKMTNRDYRVIQ